MQKVIFMKSDESLNENLCFRGCEGARGAWKSWFFVFFPVSVRERGFACVSDHFYLRFGAHFGPIFKDFSQRFREQILHAFLCEKQSQAPPKLARADGAGLRSRSS